MLILGRAGYQQSKTLNRRCSCEQLWINCDTKLFSYQARPVVRSLGIAFVEAAGAAQSKGRRDGGSGGGGAPNADGGGVKEEKGTAGASSPVLSEMDQLR